MKNFNWDKFANEKNKIAVWCKTEEEAIDFCKQSHEHGLDWCDGEARTSNKTYFEHYEYETCYDFRSFCEINWFELNNYTILEWSNYTNNTPTAFTKSDLKDGDFVLKRNGCVEMVAGGSEVLVCADGFNLLKNINEDLTSAIDEEFDIVRVRRPNTPSDYQFCCFEYEKGELVYDRDSEPPTEEMTLEEVCEALGKKIKIVEG